MLEEPQAGRQEEDDDRKAAGYLGRNPGRVAGGSAPERALSVLLAALLFGGGLSACLRSEMIQDLLKRLTGNVDPNESSNGNGSYTGDDAYTSNQINAGLSDGDGTSGNAGTGDESANDASAANASGTNGGSNSGLSAASASKDVTGKAVTSRAATNAVISGASNKDGGVNVDISDGSNRSHKVTYLWVGEPDPGTALYDANGSRIFINLPKQLTVRKGRDYSIDSVYAAGFKA